MLTLHLDFYSIPLPFLRHLDQALIENLEYFDFKSGLQYLMLNIDSLKHSLRSARHIFYTKEED